MTVDQTGSRGGGSPVARTSGVADGRSETSHGAGERPTAEEASRTVAVDDLLGLFGDEYVVDILRALSGGEMPARAIADECGMSRPTVYRRLDRLTDAGVVASRLRPAPGGHHRQEFRLVLKAVTVQFREDGLDSRVRVRESSDD